MLNLFLFGFGIGWLVGVIVYLIMANKNQNEEAERFLVKCILERDARIKDWEEKCKG